MEKLSETWVSSYQRVRPETVREASLVHIYPIGPTIGHRYALGPKTVIIGREEACDVAVDDHSVSRRHARIELLADGFHVIDLQSTNGSYVNDIRTSGGTPLRDGEYLRVGNVIYRFLAATNVEAQYHEEIYRLTIQDALTHLPNNRNLMEFLEREVLRTNRHRRPLSLVMFDIDRFKSINDDHGHLVGDFALRELAQVVKKLIRREDLLGRYGGEEFILIAVESGVDQAREIAERIRQAVETHIFSYETKRFRMTVSLGVTEAPLDGKVAARELIRVADENLYRAKNEGRNRVVG